MPVAAESQTTQQQRNWDYARAISRQTRADVASPYAGKYLGIVGQQVVVVANSWDELHARFNALNFDRRERVGIEASADYERIVTLWSPRLLAAKPAGDGKPDGIAI